MSEELKSPPVRMPTAVEAENQGRGDKMAAAWRNANDVPGNTLVEQVEYALTRRVYSVDSLRIVSDAVKALDPKLGLRFWRACGSYLDNSAEKQAIIAEVRALEPKRPEPVAAAVQSAPADFQPKDALSDHLEQMYGLGAEVRAVQA